MATKQETIDFIMDQLPQGPTFRNRKMFGEYALYCKEKVVALVCDDQLYVKMNEASLTYIDAENAAPPYPGAKDYLRVSEDKWEDREWLTKLLLETEKLVPAKKTRKK